MSWVIETLLTLAAVLMLRLFVVNVARIQGGSMLPTLHNRDFALVWRLPYLFREPRRGDVVICHYPGRKMKRLPFLPQAFVKRVIGLPGDTLEWVEGELLLNGTPLAEPYLDPARCRFPRTRPPVTLSPDEYFVLGDNRDSSNDSRRVGPLRRRAIRGRVVCILFPLKRIRRIR
ncbi:MAG: signal peptidase I [Clostridia bacterium]|nr:signal peptidase I [Clostridia bacterium]